MTQKEIVEYIEKYIQEKVYDEISFTTMLKVDKFFLDLKEKIRLEETFNDRIEKTN